jgi:hypothetical protein
MGTDPGPDQNTANPQFPEEGDDGGSDHRGGFAASDALASITADDGNQAAVTATLNTETDIVPFGDGHAVGVESAGTGDLLGDNDLLGAVTSMPFETVSNVDHALDQLTTSIDLFDVPALDFHDVLPT